MLRALIAGIIVLGLSAGPLIARVADSPHNLTFNNLAVYSAANDEACLPHPARGEQLHGLPVESRCASRCVIHEIAGRNARRGLAVAPWLVRRCNRRIQLRRRDPTGHS